MVIDFQNAYLQEQSNNRDLSANNSPNKCITVKIGMKSWLGRLKQHPINSIGIYSTLPAIKCINVISIHQLQTEISDLIIDFEFWYPMFKNYLNECVNYIDESSAASRNKSVHRNLWPD